MKHALALFVATMAIAVLPYVLAPPPNIIRHAVCGTETNVVQPPLIMMQPPDPITPTSMVPLPLMPMPDPVPCLMPCLDNEPRDRVDETSARAGKHLKPLG